MCFCSSRSLLKLVCIAVVVKYDKPVWVFFLIILKNKPDALFCFSEQPPVQQFRAESLATAKRDSPVLASVLASDFIVPLKEEEQSTLKAVD